MEIMSAFGQNHREQNNLWDKPYIYVTLDGMLYIPLAVI